MQDSTSWRLLPLPKPVVFALALASVCLFSNFGHAVSGNIYMITSDPNYEAGTNGFAGFLRGLGYTVTVEPAGGGPYRDLDVNMNAAQLIAELEAYDLIIIHRNFGSATLNSSLAERTIWNQLRVPLLLCNAPIVRNDRWRWFNGPSGGAPVPKDFLIEAPGTHPIVAGLTGSLFNNDRTYGGVGGALGGTDGGPYMEVLARINAFGGVICMAVWDEAPGGTEERSFPTIGDETQTYYRRRVFFELHEYRNGSTPGLDPWLEVTANGRLLYADSVQFTMYGVVTPPPLVNNLTPADQTANYDISGGLSFDAASPLPISDNNIQVKLNGSNVVAGLAFSGPNTNRHVSYSGLISNFFYNLEITVSNVTGSRTVFAQFDTFVPGQTFIMATADGMNYSDFPPSGNYHAFLRVASSSARELSLYRGTSASDPLVSVFYVPATASMSTFTYVPLTDALGALDILRFNGVSAYSFFLDPVDNVTVISGDLVFVPAANVPATLRPILARARPIPNTSTSSPLTAITMDLVNRDTSVEDGSVRVSLAGIDVTSMATITHSFDGASVTYQPAAFLKPGSNYTASVSVTDETATSTTNQFSFSIRSMPAIPAAYLTEAGTGVNRGFNIRNHMEPTNAAARVFTNTAARAELQLAGLFGTNEINGTLLPASAIETVAINYGQASGGNTARFADDIIFPGGENLAASLNIALEATAYVELPAGLNRFGVRSVDGFKLTAGASFASQDIVLFAHEGPRGNQVPSEFDFLVFQSGIYALRLLYFSSGGGATVEWYGIYDGNVSPDGMDGSVLINSEDIDMTTRAPAFQSRTQLPQGPTLNMMRVGNSVVISWTSTADYQLQFKLSLSDSTWLPVDQAPVVSGGLHTVTIDNPSGTVFYRLQSQ